jgi:hypothetical protein
VAGDGPIGAKPGRGGADRAYAAGALLLAYSSDTEVLHTAFSQAMARIEG